MEQIKNVLAAIQRGAAIHPAELAQAQAELAQIEKAAHAADHYPIKQEESAEANGFLWYLSVR